MHRANIIRQTAKLASYVTTTRRPLTQVTHFSVLTQSSPVSLPKIPQIYGNNMLSNFPKVSFFATKIEPYIDIILSESWYWTKEMEVELEKLNPKLTHEFLVYLLMTLKDYPDTYNFKAFDFFKWVCDKKGFEPNSVIYNLMLRVLNGRSTMTQFWDVAREMRKKGYIVSKLTFEEVLKTLSKENDNSFITKKRRKDDYCVKSSWTKFYDNMMEEDFKIKVGIKVVEVISGSEWNEDVESKLKEIEFPLSESFLVPVLGNLRKEPLKALKFFQWVGDCRGYEHNAVTYNEMIKALANTDSIGEFWDMVNSMRSKGFEVTVDTYMESREHLPARDAGNLFLFMMDGPYKLSATDCTWTLNAISLDADPDSDLMFRVANNFKAEGNNLTAGMFGAMYKCLYYCGKLDEAQRTLEVMASHTAVAPDNSFYREMINDLCKFKKFDEAWNLMDQMEANGCAPNIKTWTQLVHCYCQGDQLDRALLCLEKMKQKRIKPNRDMLDALLIVFVSQNKHLDAYNFLSEMVNKSVMTPLRKTYKFMVEKLVEVGKLKEATEVVVMMIKHDLSIYADPFIQYISQRGTVEDVKEFLKRYDDATKPQPPHYIRFKARSTIEAAYTSCYISFMKAFLEENRDQEARELLDSSPDHVRTHESAKLLFPSSAVSSAITSWS